MNSKPYIAFFDSGVGGFTALIEVVKMFPADSFLFYGDTAHVPYGERSIADVRELTEKAVAEIAGYGVKAIVIACNTATSAAAKQLREKYDIPILGMEPAIKPALLATGPSARRVLLLCTPLTAQGQKLSSLVELIDTEERLDCVPLPGLVTLAEELDFSSSRVMACLEQNILSRPLEQYGAIVLGCTHFVWYRELLRQVLPAHIQLFDGNSGTLKYLQRILQKSAVDKAQEPNRREILAHFTKSISPEKAAVLQHKLGEPLRIV